MPHSVQTWTQAQYRAQFQAQTRTQAHTHHQPQPKLKFQPQRSSTTPPTQSLTQIISDLVEIISDLVQEVQNLQVQTAGPENVVDTSSSSRATNAALGKLKCRVWALEKMMGMRMGMGTGMGMSTGAGKGMPVHTPDSKFQSECQTQCVSSFQAEPQSPDPSFQSSRTFGRFSTEDQSVCLSGASPRGAADHASPVTGSSADAHPKVESIPYKHRSSAALAPVVATTATPARVVSLAPLKRALLAAIKAAPLSLTYALLDDMEGVRPFVSHRSALLAAVKGGIRRVPSPLPRWFLLGDFKAEFCEGSGAWLKVSREILLGLVLGLVSGLVCCSCNLYLVSGGRCSEE